MNRKYRVRMGDGSHRMVEATGPMAARWEAERLALDAGIDGIDPAARAARAMKTTKMGAVRHQNAIEAHDEARAEVEKQFERLDRIRSTLKRENGTPDWGQIGDLRYLAIQLRAIGDRVLNEGEYAEPKEGRY